MISPDMKLGRAEVITRSGSVALATVYDKLGRLTFGYCYLHGLFYLVFHYNYIKHNLFRCEDSKIGMLNTLLLTGVIVILWPRLLVINPERSNMATPLLSYSFSRRCKTDRARIACLYVYIE